MIYRYARNSYLFLIKSLGAAKIIYHLAQQEIYLI